ncbi:MAG: SDR family oxidoreductase [Bacteroidota bacterium]
MNKTVFITGTSSGIGKATVLYFLKNGWNVAATMRNPEKDNDFGNLPNVRAYKLDVTDDESIKNAINSAIHDFGQIDVLINNAGYAAIGIFEKATKEQIQKQFGTNVFGVMNVIRQILPYFRDQRNGTIINLSSVAGYVTFPIYSLYHGTKWALEGFSESLQYELRPFNIKVKCIEPGPIKTDFYSRSQELFKNEELNDYELYEKATYSFTQKFAERGLEPIEVAKVIFKAANSKNFRLKYPVGMETKFMLFLRRILPYCLLFKITGSVIENKFNKLKK